MNDIIENCQKRLLRRDGTSVTGERTLLYEHQLKIIVNEQPLFSLVCTRSSLRELIAGRLLTEGIISNREDIRLLNLCREELRAQVFLRETVQWELPKNSEPSCCTDNRKFAARKDEKSLKKLPPAKWSADWIFALADKFAQGTQIHKQTQGTHSCFLAKGADLLFSCEDIGRHNAVDKAAGYALLHDIPREECILYTSGRVPVDMVRKVIAAGIPVLVSKSVPTVESVKLADEYGLTLICRAYPDQFEVYRAGTEEV